jgi:hypothetical protein
MADKLRNIRSGWNVLWCPRWKFPECSIQVIGKNSISSLNRYWRLGKRFWFKERDTSELAERILPFTHVIKTFKGDRFGEYRHTVPRQADFVCQAVAGMNFDKYLSRKSFESH